jgi:hypothetical protein
MFKFTQRGPIITKPGVAKELDRLHLLTTAQPHNNGCKRQKDNDIALGSNLDT